MSFSRKLEIQFLNDKSAKDIFELVKKYLEDNQTHGRITGDGNNFERKRLTDAEIKRDKLLKQFTEMALLEDGEVLKEGHYYNVRVPDKRRECLCGFKLTEGCYVFSEYSAKANKLTFLCPECVRELFIGVEKWTRKSSYGQDRLVCTPARFLTRAVIAEAYQVVKTLSITGDRKDTLDYSSDLLVVVMGTPHKTWRKANSSLCRECRKNAYDGAYVFINSKNQMVRDLEQDGLFCSDCGVVALNIVSDALEARLGRYNSLVDPNYSQLGCKGCLGAVKCITRELIIKAEV
jgi:hypothetical protein